MAARRPPQTGSITRLGNDRWQIRADLGKDPVSGERRRVTRNVRGNKRDAEAALKELAGDRSRLGPDLTLGALIAAWRSTAHHAAGTARNYDRAEKLIPAHLLETKAGRIDASVLDRLYRTLANDGVSVHAIVTLHAMLSAAYSQAEKWWDLRNIARRATPPNTPRSTRNASGLRDFDPSKLLAAAPELVDKAWLCLHLTTGARRSEVLALRWSDIDLDAGTVTISEALDPVAGGRKATKTGATMRVTIDPQSVALLRRWRSEALQRALYIGATVDRDAYVISHAVDCSRPWRPDYATKRYAKIARAAGIDGLTLHGLRHAVVSVLLSAGIDPKTVQDRVGHTRMATTTDKYGHSMPATDRAAAAVLGAAIHASQ